MKVRDRNLLVAYMDHTGLSGARLARYADCSRQFINLLKSGQKRSCTPQLAQRIEEALRVPTGTLFVPGESPETGQAATKERASA